MKCTTKQVSRVWVAVALAAWLLTGCAPGADSRGQGSSPTPDIASPVVDTRVVAQGRMVPLNYVELSLAPGGVIAEVLVQEGQNVALGQPLLRIECVAQQAALHQAEAGVAAAQSALTELEAGPRAEPIAVAQAAVAVARANLDLAQAEVERARLGVAPLEGQITAARAALQDLVAGPTQTQRDIAAMQVEIARNELWAAQGYRDGVKGAYDRKQAREYEVDQAEAAVGIAHVAHNIAMAQAKRLDEEPRAGLVGQAQAAVTTAEKQRDLAAAAIPAAQAQVAQAQSALEMAQAQLEVSRLRVSDQQLAQAAAALAQAQAVGDAARDAVERCTLRSPLSGVVTTLRAKPGETATGLGLAKVADLSVWEVETEDLTELQVVQIQPGQPVLVRPDALPDLELSGVVATISNDYQEKLGDVTYRVRIRLDASDPRLRWGMTVESVFH